MGHRLTKDDMKHDALLEQTASAAEFATEHARTLVGAIIILAAGSVGYLLFHSGQVKAEDHAAEVLHNAQYEYDSGNYVAASTHLAELERNLGGTQSGKLGMTLAGKVHAALGEWDQALVDYERAMEKYEGDPLLFATASRGRAAALESLKRNQEAADAYQELASHAENEQAKADLQLNAARNLVAAGRADEAKVLYREISRTGSNTRSAQVAALRLAELELQ